MASLYFLWLARADGLIGDIGVSIEVVITVLWGVFIGARLGYVVFYGGQEFIAEPWRIISPYDFGAREWIGIRGMSFHGGLLGGIAGLAIFTREARREFLRFSDALVQAVPIALFFGRIGNFLNHEILGRPIEGMWLGLPIALTGSPLLHPVTLYEAATEGLVLFILLSILARVVTTPGRITALFLFLYAGVRYVAEEYRAIPLPQDLVFAYFTVGQALSIGMVLLGLVIFLWPRKRVV